MEKLINRPPLFPTWKTPADIIGRENMKMFKEFLFICMSPSNGGEYPDARLNKEIGKENRTAIAKTMVKLRENGFYPSGVDKEGIYWKVTTKSDSQVLFEKGLDALNGKAKEELMDMARSGYRDIVKNTVMPEPSDIDRQFDAQG